MTFSLPTDNLTDPALVQEITNFQKSLVVYWHTTPPAPTGSGLWHLISQQHAYNFLLWHEEDLARSPIASDTEIANVKRAIDRYNQRRNDEIEKIDIWIDKSLRNMGITSANTTPLNTETPGSAIDRLSILALREFHLREQLIRADVTEEHRGRVQQKLEICNLQHSDLSLALSQLVQDLIAGRKRHRNYAALKMYNDPTLNPVLYDPKSNSKNND